MNRMQEQVREFHEKFGHPIGTKPGFGRPNLRSGLIIEEAVETSVGTVGTVETMHLLLAELKKLRESVPKAPDFVEAVDGVCDLLYVTFGAAIEFGLDIQPIFDEVHAPIWPRKVVRRGPTEKRSSPRDGRRPASPK